MALEPGTKLGSYHVTALIGEGGMGQVYQATDTKLNRQVALKILPDAFATDPDRLARFQREAQVLASLNHPNIAQIHGLEESEDTRALVLELVEGPTLADRISKGGYRSFCPWPAGHLRRSLRSPLLKPVRRRRRTEPLSNDSMTSGTRQSTLVMHRAWHLSTVVTPY